MAVDNNLTDYLTNLSSAIQFAEGGGTSKINPQDFASRIKALGALETIDVELGNSDTWSYIPNGKTGWLVLPEVFFEDDSVDIDGSLWRDGEMKGMRTAYLGRDIGTVIVARFTSTLTEVLICCAGGYEGAQVWTQTPDCTVNLTQRSESSGRITMRGWFIPHLFS